MRIKKYKLLWRILTNPKNKQCGGHFNDLFSDVLLYALNNYAEKRGEGASDVLVYDLNYGKDIFVI